MKITWGHGVIAAFVLFAGYILALVTGCLSHDVSLVADDYYAQEVAYQDRIDHEKNALSVKDEISVASNSGQVVVTFPHEQLADLEEGSIHFFRPSDKDLDLKLPLTLDGNGQFRINQSSLEPGRYEVNLSWNSQGKGFFVKKDLYI